MSHLPGDSDGSHGNRKQGAVAVSAAIGALTAAALVLAAALYWGMSAGFTLVPTGLVLVLTVFGIPAFLSGTYSVVTGRPFKFVSENDYLEFYKSGSVQTKAFLLLMITGCSGIAAIVGWLMNWENSDIGMLSAMGFFLGVLWSYVFTMHQLVRPDRGDKST